MHQEGFSFGRCELQPRQRRLLVEGQPAKLGARAFDVLVALVEHAGDLVTKDLLFERVWPGLVVEENNLQVHVSALRKLIGNDAIATIPGRGYRFTLPTRALVGSGAPMPPAAPAEARPTLAVLPFRNVGGDPAQEFFADGIAEGVISSVARSRWLRVIARNSSFSFRGPEVELSRVANELGARYVLAGSVRRGGDRLRVAAELVDVEQAGALHAVWGQHYDRRIDDLFDVQDEIASRIASCIEPEFLRREEARASESGELHPHAAGAGDLAHWMLLMRARWHFWRGTGRDNWEARRLVGLALEHKPADCASLCLLAFCKLVDVWRGKSENPKRELEEAVQLATTAARHDERDANAHFTLGTALSHSRQADRAVAELRRAIDLYPDFAAAHGELARVLAFGGRADEAFAAAERCFVLSPSDPHLSLWHNSMAIAAFTQGRHAQAASHAADAVAHRPDWFFHHYALAACLAADGQDDAAASALAEARRQMPRYPLKTVLIGHPFTNPAHAEAFVAALKRAGWTG
jgi:TolB-like protein/Flp pilus assembly protein TadD